jgi:hypothetical protein
MRDRPLKGEEVLTVPETFGAGASAASAAPAPSAAYPIAWVPPPVAAPAPQPPATQSLPAGSDIREQISQEIQELEQWAALNERDARRDDRRFWMLKIPALVASSFAGVFGYFDLHAATILSGAVGSFCVLADGLNPGGMLRNVHVRAVFDLRQLENDLKTRLRFLDPADDSLGRLRGEVSRAVQSERHRIGTYLKEAESNLGKGKGARGR